MAYHIWSQEEVALLQKEIKKSPTNLTQAFKKVAKALNRSTHSVKSYYYKAVQKNTNNKLFLTVSQKKVANNYKVTRKGKSATKYQPEPTKKPKWKRILAILAE